MVDDPSCSSWGACEENMEHIFHSCPNAVVVWGSLVPHNKHNRNDIVFQDASFNGSTIIAQCRAWERVVRSNEIKKLIVKNRVTKLIQWFAPASGCWKLNTDGAVKHSTKEASAGGVIRNSNG
ncbi:uncharacterized protein LOC121809106 [Salvia splendens]|nr:uncharacterized protein LOC121809106 [Salvia splendens]